jgi:hypothetical protein
MRMSGLDLRATLDNIRAAQAAAADCIANEEIIYSRAQLCDGAPVASPATASGRGTNAAANAF